MTDILVPSKLKPINQNFWQKIIEQKPKLYKNYEPPTLKSPTVLIGCLPFPSQQRALLDSLFGQLILYYLNTSSKPTKHSKIKHSPSFFEFGRFSLITFLHSSQFARLLSSCPEPDLGFFSKRHQHFSFVFHSLFDVKLPSGFDGFDLSEFSPEIPLTPSTTYSKKLHEAGFVDSKLYPVQIEPKTIVDIRFGHNSDSELVIPFSTDSLDKEKSEEFWKNRKGVLEFAFWMEKTGKQGKDTVNTTMLQNLKLDKKSTPAQFAQKFCKIRELLDQKELERFKNSFEKTESETGCVD
uniref:Uncharacterized protein n=1 Tax=Panagrolaimus sp. JU765 TaxID=591449 RepID=A0AC34Q326_9BILA